jgi:hypothetical protein
MTDIESSAAMMKVVGEPTARFAAQISMSRR